MCRVGYSVHHFICPDNPSVQAGKKGELLMITKEIIGKIILFILNCLFSFLILFPIIYCFNVSNMGTAEIYSYPPKFFPQSFGIENYLKALELAPFFRFILNSFIVSTVCTAAQLTFGALAAYAFSTFKFRGKNFLFFLMLCTMMIPGQAIIVANYLTISHWQINNTYLALMLPNLVTAFAVFNMRQAFLSLPKELKEASMIDGCGNFKFFYKVGLPLIKPFLGALGIYTFLECWNAYTWPLLVTDSVEMRTVQIGLGMLQDGESTSFGPVMAGAMMILLPSVIAFVLGQKQLVEGLTMGAVKG
jgi:sn-glycerol 3-phosphate transport system permease protein